jgi:hypothetical protein
MPLHWPVHSPPIADAETAIWQLYYLGACPTPSDPTMVWGTDVDMTGLEKYLEHANAESPVLISPAHMLLRAVGLAMRRHPEFNRRVIARRVYQYRDVHLFLSLYNPREKEIELLLLEDVDRRSLVDLSRELWRYGQQAARDELVHFGQRTIYDLLPKSIVRRLIPFHLWLFNRFNWPITRHWRREHRAAMLVNYLAYKGAAPMRMYKPSRFPNDATPFNVTLGATEPRPAVVEGKVAVRPLAPLFVRADHRIVDAHDLGMFANTLRELLSNPALMDRETASVKQPLAA